MKVILALTLLFFIFFSSTFAQKSKHGSKIVSGVEIVNEYTSLVSDAAIGETTLEVVNSGLNTNGRFSGNLEEGDLLYIIQMQGVTIESADTGSFSWGEIIAYNNCGLHEYAEVSGVSNGTTIELSCPLRNNYQASGKVNVIRVPRYADLSIPLNQTLTGEAWNGNEGGVIVVEVEGDVTVEGEIEMDAKGFRGTEGSTNNNGGGLYAFNEYATTVHDIGALKGEGIAGYHTDYDTLGGRFGQGAAANAGGGGVSLNAGGGGGSNVGDISIYEGWGVPDRTSDPNYSTAWTLEGNKRSIGIDTVSSSGGGRGGYTLSDNSEDPLTLAPWEPAWGGNERRAAAAGLGGRPLEQSSERLFLGGGGGQGHGGSWDSAFLLGDGLGGAGGSGGGMIIIKSYSSILGTGTVRANGGDGKGGEGTFATSFYGGGGAGAGGTIVVEANGTIAPIAIKANGGAGGSVTNANIFEPNRLTGPGGGGAGGYVRTSSSGPIVNIEGGANGVMTDLGILEDKFEPNGATFGDTGIVEIQTVLPDPVLLARNDTVCTGENAELSVLASNLNGSTIYWFDAAFGGNQIGEGLTFNLTNLQNDSTVYAGVCPGENRVAVLAKAVDQLTLKIDDNSQKLTCSGLPVEISATGNDFAWYPSTYIADTTLASVVITPYLSATELDTLLYYVQIEEGSCTALDSVSVVVVRKPLIQVPSELVSRGCQGELVDLSTGNSAGSGESITYLWNDGELSGLNVSVLFDQDKEMKITAIDDVYGCRDSNVFDITVSIVESEFIYADTCFGDETTFTSLASSNVGSLTSSEWFINELPMSGIDWNDSTGVRTFNPSGNYTVSHVSVNELNCVDTVTKIINIRELPNESLIIGSKNTCVNKEVSYSSVYRSDEGASLLWDLGNETSSILDSGTTTYDSLGVKTISLTVTDKHSCTNIIIDKVNVLEGPSANFNLPDTVTYGEVITSPQLDVSGVSGGAEFYWLSEEDTISTALLPKITADQDGEKCYTLTVVSPIGCEDTYNDCMLIEGEPIRLPNLFSPNGDGYNDALEVVNSEGKIISIEVFNRWGESVYKDDDYKNDWSGVSTAGRPLSTGTYFVVMKDVLKNDSESVNGFIYLTK